MGSIIQFILTHINNVKFWLFVIIAAIIIFFLFPYIDANIFYYSRMERRAEILSILSSVNIESINENPALLTEYNSILDEVNSQKDRTIYSIFNNNENVDTMRISITKFITGGLLAWIMVIWVPFMNTFTNRKEKALTIFVMIFIALVAGGIAITIPTFNNPIVNYIGINVFWLIVIVLIALMVNNNKKQKDN